MVFNKSQNLYALNFAKNAGEKRLILAEGYMDVIALHQAGFPTAVATLGTSLTTEQARLIARYAQEAVICVRQRRRGPKGHGQSDSHAAGGGASGEGADSDWGKKTRMSLSALTEIRARPDSSSFWKHLETMWNIGCKRPQTAWIYPSLMGKSHI